MTANRHFTPAEITETKTEIAALIESNLTTERISVDTLPGRGRRCPVFEIKLFDTDGDIAEDDDLRNALIDLVLATGKLDTVLMGPRSSAAPADVKVAGYGAGIGLCKILVCPI